MNKFVGKEYTYEELLKLVKGDGGLDYETKHFMYREGNHYSEPIVDVFFIEVNIKKALKKHMSLELLFYVSTGVYPHAGRWLQDSLMEELEELETYVKPQPYSFQKRVFDYCSKIRNSKDSSLSVRDINYQDFLEDDIKVCMRKRKDLEDENKYLKEAQKKHEEEIEEVRKFYSDAYEGKIMKDQEERAARIAEIKNGG